MTKSSLARRSIQALAVAGVFVACLLPPPVAVETQVNQSPYVVNESAKPQKAFVELNLNCATCTFSVEVKDPDAGDSLYARWFFDYDTAPFTIPCGGKVPAPDDANAERTPASCDVPINTHFPPDFDGTTHTLEAWVSDRDFTDGGRSLADDAFVAVKQWTVRVHRRGVGCDDLEQLGCKAQASSP
jgi:hypothetical protein